MDTAEGSQRAVRERLESIHEAYGEFDVFGETVAVPPDRYRDHRETLASDGVGRARVWVGNDDRGLLLTRPREGPDVWTVPGTSARADEPIEAAAERCVREGATLECTLTGVYRVERVELRDDADPDAAPLYDLVVHFDAAVGDRTPTPGDGVEAAAFHDAPPSSVDRLVASRLEEWDSRSRLGPGVD